MKRLSLLQDDALFGGQEVIVFNATGSPFLLPTADEPTEDIQVTGEVAPAGNCRSGAGV